ncbi:phage holin family protein [Uliginosibacterium sp. H1]|uniref:phage holin family protein n=1 Tax=Uliginosibacterium sp. H1 TaxID=3114757 RepID=UPI002E19FA80|nr:phage holin family protein [Uliginosibacterium sp. H1]
MMLLIRWALGALALMIVPEIVSSIRVESYLAALAAALLLGLVNALIRPILILLTLPITVLTLGIFALVINALLFWGVSELVTGFRVDGFWAAMWGALVYGVLTWMINLALADRKK